ncbi:MAG TPA: ABC transporter permease [Fimbriimonadaceae bacterium]|nr:ABC transporter permease [Fimbriimonadaceae bacterium]
MLISGIVALMDSIPLSVKTVYSYAQYELGVSPRGDEKVLDDFRETVRESAPVPIDRVIVCRASSAMVDSIVGKWPFVVFGFEQGDMRYYINKLNGGKVIGRFPEVGAPEAMVSRPVATNLNLKVGSTLLSPDDPDSYSPMPVKVTGIVDTDQWIMFVPIEYHRLYHFPPVDGLLVFAKNLKDQHTLDSWALKTFKGGRTRLYAYQEVQKETDQAFRTLFAIVNVVIASLVAVLTIIMGMLFNIYQSQRVQEFGLLQALGYPRGAILRRILAETAIVLLGSWILAVFIAVGLLVLIKVQMFDPRAYAINATSATNFLYSVPVPIMIFIVAAFDVVLRLKKFDPVRVVERRLV